MHDQKSQWDLKERIGDSGRWSFKGERVKKGGSHWGCNHPLLKDKTHLTVMSLSCRDVGCQLGISLGALSHATSTTLYISLSHQRVSVLFPKVLCLIWSCLTFSLLHLLNSLPLEWARSIPSQWQTFPIKPQFIATLLPSPSHKCRDEYGADGYFRMEVRYLVILRMIDSSQDKEGRTEGWTSKLSRIGGTLFLEGLRSVARCGSMTFVLICEEMKALDPLCDGSTLKSDSHNGFSAIISSLCEGNM